MNDAYDGLAVGFAYKNIELAIAAALHAEKLACCRIDPGLYRGFVDPTHFAAEAILAAVKSGLSINGNVHWSERFVMTARIPLGQPLTMSGEIAMIEPHPRGSHMRSVFAYTLPDGSVPLRTERTSLRLDPGRPRPAAGKVPAPPDLSAFETVAEFSFEPDLVARYSAEGNNRIHFDPDVAKEFGFRAPPDGGAVRRQRPARGLRADRPLPPPDVLGRDHAHHGDPAHGWRVRSVAPGQQRQQNRGGREVGASTAAPAPR